MFKNFGMKVIATSVFFGSILSSAFGIWVGNDVFDLPPNNQEVEYNLSLQDVSVKICHEGNEISVTGYVVQEKKNDIFDDVIEQIRLPFIFDSQAKQYGDTNIYLNNNSIFAQSMNSNNPTSLWNIVLNRLTHSAKSPNCTYNLQVIKDQIKIWNKISANGNFAILPDSKMIFGYNLIERNQIRIWYATNVDQL